LSDVTAPLRSGVVLERRDGLRVAARQAVEGSVLLRVWHDGDRVGIPPGAIEALDAPWPDAGALEAPSAEGVTRADGEGLALRYDRTRGGVLRAIDDAGRTVVETAAGGLEADPGAARAQILLAPGAEVYGLGAKTGPLGRRGRRFRFWNRDVYPHNPDTDPLYTSLPVALIVGPDGSATGMAALWGGEVIWDVGHDRADRMGIASVAGGLELLFVAGPRPADVMRRLAQVLGRPFLPPLWALGYQQSHWGYGDAAGFTAVAAEFRARAMPLDALYMDLDYMQERRPLVFDPERFPDPKAFVDGLHALDVKVVPISNAGVPVDDPRFAEAREGGALVQDADGQIATGPLWGGLTAITDFLRPAAAALWDRFSQPLLDTGVDGIWNDMNEPSFIIPDGEDPRGPRTLPAASEHVDASGQSWRHDQVHSVFALFMNRATTASLRAHRPGRRPFILSRAGFPGVGRYAAIWTGDNASWWDHLRISLPMTASLGVSGVPLGGVDIGGFNDEVTPELFARWIEAGSLMPLCRNHSSIVSSRQEPYAFGPEVEAIGQRHLRNRYALLPTLYALAYAAHRDGAPIWRPLAYDFPADAQARHVEDEVMVGPDLLMAPVVDPGARSRRVYLPAGTWYRIDAGRQARLAGGGDHLAQAPLETMPLFARGGAVVAFDPDPADRARPPRRIELHLFPDGEGGITLFEDDGDSDAHERGDMRCTRVFWREAEGSGHLLIERVGGRAGAALYLRMPADVEIVTARADGEALDPVAPLPEGDRVEIRLVLRERR